METFAAQEQPGSQTAIVSTQTKSPVYRNTAVDAYRGFVMVLMMAEVLQLAQVARAFPGNWFWAFLGYNQTHVESADVPSTT